MSMAGHEARAGREQRVLVLRNVLKNPELQKRLLETGSEFQPLFGAELARFIQDEEKHWWPLVKKYGVN